MDESLILDVTSRHQSPSPFETSAHFPKSFEWDQKIIEEIEKPYSRAKKPGLVYTARLVNHSPTNLVKIGKSIHPMRRMKSQRCPTGPFLEPAFYAFGRPSLNVYLLERLTHKILGQWNIPPECNDCGITHEGLQTEAFAVEPKVPSYTVAWLRIWMQTRPYNGRGELKPYWKEALESFDGYSDCDETPLQRSNRWKIWIEERLRLKNTIGRAGRTSVNGQVLRNHNSASDSTVITAAEERVHSSTSSPFRVSTSNPSQSSAQASRQPSRRQQPLTKQSRDTCRSNNQETAREQSCLTTTGAVTLFVISYILAVLIDRLGIAMTFGVHMLLGLFSLQCSRYLLRFLSEGQIKRQFTGGSALRLLLRLI